VSLRSDGGPFGTCRESALPYGTCQEARSNRTGTGGGLARTVWNVSTIGERIRALREARGATQEQFADGSGGALTRPYVVKLERSGENKGHRSTKLRDGVAAFAGSSLEDAKRFVEGEIDVPELLSKSSPKPLPPKGAQPTPVADRPRWTSWLSAVPIIRRRMRDKDPDDLEAAMESLEQDAFYAEEDPTKGAGVAWWVDAIEERYALLRSETAKAAAIAADATTPIAKSQLKARVATELDDIGGHDPDAPAQDASPAKPPKTAPQRAAKVSGRTPPRAK
jgi:transcriptional regulator with XRE-family HTH domain